MKFTLTYDGELPGTGNSSRKPEKKREIREHFSPQLAHLWKIHPALMKARRHRYLPKQGGFLAVDSHHSEELAAGIQEKHENSMDLCAQLDVGGQQFLPLVRASYGTVCALNILFLRQEAAGKVYQGGDLDNRIKTLLDALAMPQDPKATVVDQPDECAPIFCLLEDDALVTGLAVETRRLLTRPDSPENEVRLIIEVDVRVPDARVYNTLFLGD